MLRRWGPSVAVALVALVAAGADGPKPAAAASACVVLRASSEYTRSVEAALRSRRDVWGNALIASPGGPTYEGVRRYLHPLFLARAARGSRLTASDAHYLPLGLPATALGAGSVALHVADGSQIVSDRAGGHALTVGVGVAGRERFGACRSRLAEPRLLEGWLPVLQTEYVDRVGARYAQESFALRIPETRWIVSFVRVDVDARSASTAVSVRFAHSGRRLSSRGNRLLRGSNVWLVYGGGGRYDGRGVSYAVARGSRLTTYAAWLNYPRVARPFTVDAARHERMRNAVVAHWRRKLAPAAPLEVPDVRVAAARDALLVQNLTHGWRYSIGNQYEQFSFPESPDLGVVLGEWGFASVHAAVLRVSYTRRRDPYANWKMATKLVAAARHWELFRQRAFVDRSTPVLARYVDDFARQLRRSPRALLARERFSSDIPDQVYGLHGQAMAWQGLVGVARMWRATGRGALAARAAANAARLERGLRVAVATSQRRLPDGSLFLPARLLAGERPYATVTQSRPGSYWNLVIPYALASGLFPFDGPQARGALRYLELHGARLLGLVRAGAFALYGRSRRFPTGGTVQVYGLNQSRFLAAMDVPDELALTLYGHLGAAMTPGTFVSGEAATVQPLRRAFHRTMYLPPNAASNASFLGTLRLMLVHERRDRRGAPVSLRLAPAVPRAWLRPGRRVSTGRLPTAFGAVGFTLDVGEREVRAVVDLPARAQPPATLRLRLPTGSRVTTVTVDGRATEFDRRDESIPLPRTSGRVEVVAAYVPAD